MTRVAQIFKNNCFTIKHLVAVYATKATFPYHQTQ